MILTFVTPWVSVITGNYHVAITLFDLADSIKLALAIERLGISNSL